MTSFDKPNVFLTANEALLLWRLLLMYEENFSNRDLAATQHILDELNYAYPEQIPDND